MAMLNPTAMAMACTLGRAEKPTTPGQRRAQGDAQYHADDAADQAKHH